MAGNKKDILVDLGCGLNPAPYHLGLDIRKISKADIISDVSFLPFKKETIDGFNARHVMEHLSSEQIFSVLKQVAECLKINGSITITVPHFSSPLAFHFDHKSFWSYNSPHTLTIDGQHDEWIGSHFELLYIRFFWMRKKYRGKFPLLVKIMNSIINKSQIHIERISFLFGGIYEMEFCLKKVR